jgi:predicted esterase YcpF (UPF0227 family)
MRLIYIHGFRSSSRSFKARLLHARLAAVGKADRFFAPDLPPEPDLAIALIRERLAPAGDDTLVGSSLGGCYARWLAEQTGCKAVLLNPAVHPARDLQGQVGPQSGYHDGQPFQFEARFLAQLQRYEVAEITRPERYFLIAAQGDEVLDWREMAAAFAGARQKIVPGSDHGLSDFEAHIDEVLAFAGFTGVNG